MPLSAIVIVVLRLVAIYWMSGALFAAISVAFEIFRHSAFLNHSWRDYVPLLGPLGQMLISGLICKCSRAIGRAVTPLPDPDVNFASLTQYDLYCFAFTYLGLYFALDSFAVAFNWLHYWIIPRPGQEKVDGFYHVMAPLLTFFAGCVSMLFSHRFARKLSDFQRKPAEPGNPQTPPG